MSINETSQPVIDQSAQMSAGSLSMAWYGLVSAMFFVYVGAALAKAYGTVNAIVGLVLTIIVYGAINRVLATYALRHGLTVARFSRTLLGRSGAILATIIFAATAIYYAVFEGSILAVAFRTQFGGPLTAWYAIIVVYTAPLVAGGIRHWLDKINGWLMPIYWGGLITAVVWAGAKYGFNGAWITHSVPGLSVLQGGPGWLGTFSAYMGVWILMMYTMDFAALGRVKDARFHRNITFGWLFYSLAFGANALIGIFLTYSIPGLQATEGGVAVGLVNLMGLLGLLVVFVSQTRINTANYALGISNLKEFGERTMRIRLPLVVWTAIGAAIIFALMLLPVVKYLLLALSWQGSLVTGWVAIALAHIYLERKGTDSIIHPTQPDSAFAHFKPAGISAWIISAACGIFLIQSHWPWGATLGSIATPVLAFVIYLAVAKLGAPSVERVPAVS